MNGTYQGKNVRIICRGAKNTRIQHLVGLSVSFLVPTSSVILGTSNSQFLAPAKTQFLPKTSVGHDLQGKPTLDSVSLEAHNLMDLHGLLAKGWEFGYDDARCRAGLCRSYQKKIFLSRFLVLLNGWEVIIDTLLHEIAHALVGWSGYGHNKVWKAKCIEIGASPIRCYDPKKVKMPMRLYRAICSTCGKVYERAFLPRHTIYHCNICGMVNGTLTWKNVGLR